VVQDVLHQPEHYSYASQFERWAFMSSPQEPKCVLHSGHCVERVNHRVRQST